MLLRFPPDEIYYDAIHEFGAEGGSVVLRLQTDAGIVGWAECTFGTMTGAPEVLQTILQKELKSVLIGKDPAFPRRLRSEMWKALEYAGVQGMNTFAISTVDIAIWDIVQKLSTYRPTRSWVLIRRPAPSTRCAAGTTPTMTICRSIGRQ